MDTKTDTAKNCQRAETNSSNLRQISLDLGDVEVDVLRKLGREKDWEKMLRA